MWITLIIIYHSSVRLIISKRFPSHFSFIVVLNLDGLIKVQLLPVVVAHVVTFLLSYIKQHKKYEETSNATGLRIKSMSKKCEMLIFQKLFLWVQHVSWKLENKKTPNSGFCFDMEPKYVTSWIICVQLFKIYAFHSKWYQSEDSWQFISKSRIWMQHLFKTGNPKKR